MKKSSVITNEFRVPIWSAKKVREYLEGIVEVYETYHNVKEIKLTEDNYMIFIVFTVFIKGKRKSIRELSHQIKQKVEKLQDE